MRVMVSFQFPAESGNEVIRSGKINKVFEGLMQDLKPEAAYFYPEDGQRAGHFICDLAEPSRIVDICERFWFGLGADVRLTPVMTAEDLQKGLSGIEAIIRSYG